MRLYKMENLLPKTENHEASRVSKFMLYLSLLTLFLAAILIVFFSIVLTSASQKVAETAAYTRASNCISARLASDQISQKEIEDCYAQVEKDTDISLERFDKQTSPDN